MFRNLISTRFRLTMGIVSIVMTMLFAAATIRMLPNPDNDVLRSRARFSETIALTAARFVHRNDLRGLTSLLESCVSRDPSVYSIGLRNPGGQLLVESGNHNRFWEKGAARGNHHISVPISRWGRKFAEVEIAFQPISATGWLGLLSHPWTRLFCFLGSACFLSIAFYLSLMLRQLDPKKSVPNRVREALDNLTEGLFLLNHRGRIVLANNAFQEIVQLPPEKFLGLNPARFDWRDEQDNRLEEWPWQEALEQGITVVNRMMRLKQDNAAHQTFKVNCTPVGSGERPDGVMVCFENVTLLDQAREEVQKSRDAADAANRAKSQFLANMSHEIRTPMNAILGFTDLLQRGLAQSEQEQGEYLRTIETSGMHLLELINDILDLSKIEAGKMEMEITECAPFELLNDVINILGVRAAEKEISLSLEARDGLPQTIKTDPVRFRQVVTNLVGNAIKFTETGGVKIAAWVSRESDTGPLLHIDVVDTGIGMTESQLERVFDPFTQADSSVTRRFGGTGLGLSISQRIVRALGGDLSARSIYGQGSVFSFMIATGPLENVGTISHEEFCQSARSATRTRKVSWQLPSCRILVVDDGEANRRLINLFLTRAGCQVDQAENGQIAVEMVNEKQYDLLLMDMQMPVLDGYEATRRLRADGYSFPIIALTANAMHGDEQKCLDAGCTGFLTKPVNMDKLVAAIGEALAVSASPVEESGSLQSPVAPAASDPQPELPQTPTAENQHGFAGVLETGMAGLKSAWQRRDNAALIEIGEELVQAANAFGETAQASMLDRMVTAVRDGNNRQFAEIVRKLVQPTVESSNGQAEKQPESYDDRSQPRRIQSSLPMDEPEFREIVAEFIPVLDERIEEMRAVIRSGNLDELARLAHWLKGSGGTVGFHEFYEPSLALEKAAKRGQRSGLERLLGHIETIRHAIETPDVV